MAGGEGVGVVRAEDTELVIKQLAECGRGVRRISGLGLPVGEVVPDRQGAGMVPAEYRYLIVEELPQLGHGGGRVSGSPSPVGEIMPGGQGVRMRWPENP